MFSSLIFYIYIRVLHFLVFYICFLSIKKLTILVLGCSMFGFLAKRVIIISLRVFFVCFFI